MKKQRIAFVVLLTAASLTPMAQAVPRSILLNQDICATKNTICLRGSLYFDEGSEQMSFSGRVNQSTQPGKLIIKLKGESDSGKTYKVKLSQTIEGRYSEIVDIKQGFNITNAVPQEIKWAIEEVNYKFSKE